MTTKKRIEQLEKAVKANQPPEVGEVTSWKDLIERAEAGKAIPSWDAFIAAATNTIERNPQIYGALQHDEH